mmetsp:Transcript_45991/g.77308  ORF Transcript_45991/g.77308 Transcript_45991/m.77308 type:complete len:207 (-) Transcript_45991:662-1282(-)
MFAKGSSVRTEEQEEAASSVWMEFCASKMAWHSCRISFTAAAGRSLTICKSWAASLRRRSCRRARNARLAAARRRSRAASTMRSVRPRRASLRSGTALKRPAVKALRRAITSSGDLACRMSASRRPMTAAMMRYTKRRPWCTSAAHSCNTDSDGKTSANRLMDHCVTSSAKSKSMSRKCCTRSGIVSFSSQSTTCMSTIAPERLPK